MGGHCDAQGALGGAGENSWWGGIQPRYSGDSGLSVWKAQWICQLEEPARGGWMSEKLPGSQPGGTWEEGPENLGSHPGD